MPEVNQFYEPTSAGNFSSRAYQDEQRGDQTEARLNYGMSAQPSGAGFGQVKAAVADKLLAAAHKLKEQAADSEHSAEMAHLTQRAGAWFERSAHYVNDLEPQQLRADLETQVRRNPGRSLLIAGAVGLVLGRILRGR